MSNYFVDRCTEPEAVIGDTSVVEAEDEDDSFAYDETSSEKNSSEEDSESEEEDELDLALLAEKSKLISAAIINSTRMLTKALRRSARRREDSLRERGYVNLALRFAVEARHVDCARILIKHGADVNYKYDGTTLLRYAIQQEHHSVISCLLESERCKLEERDTEGGTPLHTAVHQGDLQTVEMLVAAGADINALNPSIETPLILAAQLGHEEIITRLLGLGCDVTVCKFSRRTAFHRSVECGHLSCVRTFLEHGINPHLKDADGWTALHMAANQGHEQIIKLLLNSGCSANSTDEEGRTPLFESCTRGHLGCSQTLIAAGARTHVQNQWGNTPLSEAATMGHAHIISLLLRCVTKVDTPGYRKMTALHCAATQGYPACVSALLAGGAHPDSRATKGATPLHLLIKSKLPTLPAVLANQVRIFTALLDYNCDLEATCQVTFGAAQVKKHVTPFELAVTSGQLQISCWLQLCGASTRVLHQLVAAEGSWAPALREGGGGDGCVRYLYARARQVRGLMELCRAAIRRALGGHGPVRDRVLALELPRSLRGFLSFAHLEHEARDNLPNQCLIK